MHPVHDIKLDYDSTYGHEMQIRVHAEESESGREYISEARGYMVNLVNELAYNKIREGSKTHNLSDGAVIKVRQNYGVQIIDIYPPPSLEVKKHYGIFCFKPRPDAPTAIIVESKRENATNGIELYFDDRIQGGGIHTQDNTKYSEEVTDPVQFDDSTQRDNIYSLWMDVRSTAGKNCASWSQGYLNRKHSVSDYFPESLQKCDSFKDGSTYWYYGLSTRYAYTGSRLLYEASYYDDILGVGAIGDDLLVFILINRYSTKVRLLTAPIPEINYDVHSEDSVYTEADLVELDSELITIPDKVHPLSAFTFSSDGSAGVMSIYDWHDGSTITDYSVEFEVKTDPFGEKKLKVTVTDSEAEYVKEYQTTVRKPVWEKPPDPIVTTVFAIEGRTESGDGQYYPCSPGHVIVKPDPDCYDSAVPCDCDRYIFQYKAFCGINAGAKSQAWVNDVVGDGCEDSIWAYTEPWDCVAGWGTRYNAGTSRVLRYCWGSKGAAAQVYPNCAASITTTTTIGGTTPDTYATSKTVVNIPKPMPFASVMGPHGGLITADYEYASRSYSSGSTVDGYADGGQTIIEVSANASGVSPVEMSCAVAAALNRSTHNGGSYSSTSFYEETKDVELIQTLPWDEYKTTEEVRNKTKHSSFGLEYPGYSTYYCVSLPTDGYDAPCGLGGIGSTWIPGIEENSGSTTSTKKTRVDSKKYMEGDLRYEIACSVKSEIDIDASSGSSYTDNVETAFSKYRGSYTARYMIEGLEIPGLDSYQKVEIKSSGSSAWMTVPDRDSDASGSYAMGLEHKKPLGLAFMAHPKGYALVSLSDKRFRADENTDPDVDEVEDWKVTLQFYNKETDELTDIIKLYNDALKPYNEYIVENGGTETEELQTDISAINGTDKGKLNQMGENFGVLSRIPKPQIRF